MHIPGAWMLKMMTSQNRLFPSKVHRIFSRNRFQSSRISSLDSARFILGIESSCDDTGVAVISSTGEVLGESLATQTDIHAAWGGVVPKLAQEAHSNAIDGCIDEALSSAGIVPSDLSAIAVTIGPGLSLCLRVGVLAARKMSSSYSIPIIPIHHMEAHALVARLPAAGNVQPNFPFLCLLVSGGHNLLVIVEKVGHYIQLGTTLDDAIGEAYDKVARMLGLRAVPSGGAAIEALAQCGDPHAVKLPVPMRQRPSCDFSFAGLKTAVRMLIESEHGKTYEDSLEDVGSVLKGADGQFRANIAASFQEVAVTHLEERVRRGLTWAKESHPDIEHLVVAGGVASNSVVRSRLASVAELEGMSLVCPPPRLCTDNGVMVAWAGVERLLLTDVLQLAAHTTAPEEGEWVDLRPRWPLTESKDGRSYSAPRSQKKVRLFPALTG